jgi:hypothetical protein
VSSRDGPSPDGDLLDRELRRRLNLATRDYRAEYSDLPQPVVELPKAAAWPIQSCVVGFRGVKPLCEYEAQLLRAFGSVAARYGVEVDGRWFRVPGLRTDWGHDAWPDIPAGVTA